MVRRKNRLRTDAVREIKNTFSRFLSILVLSALAVAFLSGLRAAAPDMQYTADNYYDRTHLMDGYVLSTLGLTREDLDALAAADGIEQVEGAWTVDVIAAERIVSVRSLPERLNLPEVQEGRLPQSADECVTERLLLIGLGLEIGDTLELTLDGDNEGDLACTAYTIVGVVNCPLYVGTDRGSSSLGSGKVDGFVFVPGENFTYDYFTIAYFTGEGLEALDSYGGEYEDRAEALVDSLDGLADERAQLRYDTLIGDAQKELDGARAEFEDAKGSADRELADAWQKLQDARRELDDGWADYYEGIGTFERETADAEKELEDALEKLNDAERELADGRQKYADGLAEYQDALAELEEGRQKYEDGLAAYEDARALYEDGLAKYEDGLAEYEDGLAKYEDGLAKYEDAKALYEDGLAAYEDAKALYEDGLAQYRDGMAAYDRGLAEYQAGVEQLNAAQAELDKNRAFLEEQQAQYELGMAYLGQLDQDNPLYETLKKQLEESKARLDEGWAGLEEGQALLDRKKAQLPAAEARLAASRAELRAVKARLDDALVELNEGWAELEEAKVELEEGWAELEDAKAELEEGWPELEDARIELEDAKAELDEGWAELEDARMEIEDGQRELDEGWAELEDARMEIEDGEREIADGWRDYYSGRDELDQARVDGQQELADALAELEDGEIEYADGLAEYEDGKREAEEEIADAQKKLDDAQAELDKVEECEWYVLGRNTNAGFVSFSQDTERVGNLAAIFPVIFFLVAALACLTTMTRMVEEQRTQIGALKALGFSRLSISTKYLGYAFLASLIGGVLGLAVGGTLIPAVIANAFNIMYAMPSLEFRDQTVLCILSVLAAVACTTGAALWACLSTLMDTPANLMRPRAPKAGRRVLLERVGFIWKRLTFTWKVTMRNLFRYQRRFWMTVIGIGGCTALIVTGFGLHESIFSILNEQFDHVFLYGATLGIDPDAGEEKLAEVERYLTDSPWIEDYLPASAARLEASSDGPAQSVTMFAISDQDRFTQFIRLGHRLDDGPVVLPEHSSGGVFITEKLSELLGVSAGDTIVLDGDKRVEVRVADIVENYVQHYVYLSETCYRELFGEGPEQNEILLRYTDEAGEAASNAMSTSLMAMEAVTSYSYIATLRDTFTSSMEAIDYAVVIIIISAAALAFVVLYNLTNINITERTRELATLKVLGFFDQETTAYVYRENIFLTVFGIVLGLVLGRLLHAWMVVTVEVDIVMFGRTAPPYAYVLAAVLTAVFSIMVNIAAHFKLKKVDMVESLKTVE